MNGNQKDFNQKVLVFDIRGPFAYFRVPRTTRMVMSYPFPPKTVVFGLLAGIIGLKRNKYWKEGHTFNEMMISIEILHISNFSSLRVLYEQTKQDFSKLRHYSHDPFYMLKPEDTMRRGFTTRQKLHIARDVHYRIYCKFPKESKYFEMIKNSLIEHKYIYPPYLGNVNFFCELEYIGVYNVERISKSTPIRIDTLIPTSYVDPDDEKFKYGQFEMYFNVPTEYTVEKRKLKGKRKQFEIPGINYWRIVDVDYQDYIYHQSQDPIELKIKNKIPIDSVQELETIVAWI